MTMEGRAAFTQHTFRTAVANSIPRDSKRSELQRGGRRGQKRRDEAHRIPGELAAFSHTACDEARPGWTPLPCPTFEDAFAAVSEGRAELAMIPIENS